MNFFTCGTCSFNLSGAAYGGRRVDREQHEVSSRGRPRGRRIRCQCGLRRGRGHRSRTAAPPPVPPKTTASRCVSVPASACGMATETMRDAKRSSPACGMAATKRMRRAARSSTAWIALLLCTSSADALSAPTTPSPPKWSVVWPSTPPHPTRSPPVSSPPTPSSRPLETPRCAIIGEEEPANLPGWVPLALAATVDCPHVPPALALPTVTDASQRQLVAFWQADEASF